MGAFFQALGLIVVVGLAYLAGRTHERNREDDEGATEGDVLPARHRRTPVRPWTPEDKPSRWVADSGRQAAGRDKEPKP